MTKDLSDCAAKYSSTIIAGNMPNLYIYQVHALKPAYEFILHIVEWKRLCTYQLFEIEIFS